MRCRFKCLPRKGFIIIDSFIYLLLLKKIIFADMKHIVLFGAGKSATCLIDYLLKEILLNNWKLTVCDSNLALAQSKIGNAQNAFAVSVLVENDEERNELVASADIIISLLPPELHFIVAKDCVVYNKNLLTASYVDENIKSLSEEIKNRELLFLCEMGLDPGIDHMSAMKLIQSIKNRGGRITSFISHCGGLVVPESDYNPWHYKVTWNPRNVVLAGKDGATYREENEVINIPYHKIFRDNSLVDISSLEPLAWYPNRDSLHYISLYSLNDISTFIRTTLRYPQFCRGWQKFVATGCTSVKDTEQIKHCKTFKEWFDAKVNTYVSGEKNYQQLYNSNFYTDEFNRQLNFLGYNNEEPLPAGFTCSADVLQYTLETKLAMQPHDRDMIVMLHEIEYEEVEEKGSKKLIRSCLMLKGENNVRTAMAKSVGLPLGIAAKLILQKKITLTGLYIPILPEIYEQVLMELEEHGIKFNEI